MSFLARRPESQSDQAAGLAHPKSDQMALSLVYLERGHPWFALAVAYQPTVQKLIWAVATVTAALVAPTALRLLGLA
jgi:hypothetical protein